MKKFIVLLMTLVAVFLFSCESEPEPIPKSNIQFNLDGNYGESVKYKVAYGRDGNNTEMEFFDTAVLSIPEIEAGTYDWSITAIVDGKAVPVGSGKAETKPGETKEIPVAGSPATIKITDVPEGSTTTFKVDGNEIEGTSATLWLSEGQHDISFSAAFDGEERGTIAESFTVEKGKVYSISYKCEDGKVIPQVGTIKISSNAPSYEVVVLKDDVEVGIKSVENVWTLPVGAYKVRVDVKEGNKIIASKSMDITVNVGDNADVVVSGKNVKLTYTGTPEGATTKLKVGEYSYENQNIAGQWLWYGEHDVVYTVMVDGNVVSEMVQKLVVDETSAADITVPYKVEIPVVNVSFSFGKLDIGFSAELEVLQKDEVIAKPALTYDKDTKSYKGTFDLPIGKYIFKVSTGSTSPSTYNSGEIERNVIVSELNKSIDFTIQEIRVEMPVDGLTHYWSIDGNDLTTDTYRWYILEPDEPVVFTYKGFEEGKLRYDVTSNIIPSEVEKYSGYPHMGDLTVKAPAVNMDAKLNLTVNGADAYDLIFKDRDGKIVEAGNESGLVVLPSDKYTMTVNPKVGDTLYVGRDFEINLDGAKETAVEVSGARYDIRINNAPTLLEGDVQSLKIGALDAVSAAEAHVWLADGSYDVRYEVRRNGLLVGSAAGKFDVTGTGAKISAFDYSGIAGYGNLKLDVKGTTDYEVSIKSDGNVVDVTPDTDGAYTLIYGDYDITVTAKDGERVLGIAQRTVKIDAAEKTEVFDYVVHEFKISDVPEIAAKLYELTFDIDGVSYPEEIGAASYRYWVDRTTAHTVSVKFNEGKIIVTDIDSISIPAVAEAIVHECQYNRKMVTIDVRVSGTSNYKVVWKHADYSLADVKDLGDCYYSVPTGNIRIQVSALDESGNIIETKEGYYGISNKWTARFSFS